jgi:hypothetical protein
MNSGSTVQYGSHLVGGKTLNSSKSGREIMSTLIRPVPWRLRGTDLGGIERGIVRAWSFGKDG